MADGVSSYPEQTQVIQIPEPPPRTSGDLSDNGHILLSTPVEENAPRLSIDTGSLPQLRSQNETVVEQLDCVSREMNDVHSEDVSFFSLY